MYFKHKYILMYARLAVSGDRTVVQSRKDLVLVGRDNMKYVYDVKMVKSLGGNIFDPSFVFCIAELVGKGYKGGTK